MLDELRSNDEDFFYFGLRMSRQHQEYFQQHAPTADEHAAHREQVEQSLNKQAEIEAADVVSFEQYLNNYFSQPGLSV